MAEDDAPEVRADCWECGTTTVWKPARQQGYEGFACTTCGSFQEGGMMDEDGVFWEVRDGGVRRRGDDGT